MTFRYSQGVNVTPDSAGKFRQAMAQGQDFHYYLTGYGVVISNRRGYFINHPEGMECLRAMHSDGSMVQLITEKFESPRRSVGGIIVTSGVCRYIEEYLGAGEWWYLPGKMFRRHDLSYLDAGAINLERKFLTFMPLERDAVILKTIFKNKDLGSTTPADPDSWTDSLTNWLFGAEGPTGSLDDSDKKAGTYSIKTVHSNILQQRTAELDHPDYAIQAGDKLHFWYKSDYAGTGVDWSTAAFRIELHMLGGGYFYKDLKLEEADVWQEFALNLGAGEGWSSEGGPTWGTCTKIIFKWIAEYNLTKVARIDQLCFSTPSTFDFYYYFGVDSAIGTTCAYDGVDDVIKITGGTQAVILGLSEASAGHRCCNDDFDTVKALIDANKPFPPGFNQDSVSGGHLYGYFALSLSIKSLEEKAVYFVIAFSGYEGTEAHALSECNNLKDPTNAENALSTSDTAYANYLASFPGLTSNNSIIDGAYYWARAHLKSHSYPTGATPTYLLYVLFWNGFWLRDGLLATLGLIEGGQFAEAYDNLMFWAGSQQEDGHLPETAMGDTTQIFCYVAQQLYYRSRNETYYNNLKPYLEKAYDWLVSRIETVPGTSYKLMNTHGLADMADAIHNYLLPNVMKYDGFCNVFAWRVLKEAYKLEGDASYKTAADSLEIGIDKLLWQPAYNFYAALLDTDNEIEFPSKLEAWPNLFAIVMGLCSKTRAEQILSIMDTDKDMDRVPSQYLKPAYIKGVEISDSGNLGNPEYKYQNGASWGRVGSWHVIAEAVIKNAAIGTGILEALAELNAIVCPALFCENYLNDDYPGVANGEPNGSRNFTESIGTHIFALFKALGLWSEPNILLKIKPFMSTLSGMNLSNYKAGSSTFSISWTGTPDGSLEHAVPLSYDDGANHAVVVDSTKNKITIDGTEVASRKVVYVVDFVSERKITLDSWSWDGKKGTGQIAGPSGASGTIKLKVSPITAKIENYVLMVGGTTYFVKDYFDALTETINVPVTCSSVTTITLEYRPGFAADQFDKRLLSRGVNVDIIKLTQIDIDKYKNPVYSESVTTVKGFVKTFGWEKAVQAGTVKLAKATFMISLGEAVEEEDYEIGYGGWRWKIAAINVKRAYLEVIGERKVS